MRASLSELEAVLDGSGATEMIELVMPAGGRPRQLPVRSLLLGVLLAASDDRPAHLTRAHEALMSLPAADKERLGVTASWRGGSHELTYRQVEHTTRSLRAVFSAEASDGGPGRLLSAVVDALVEASISAALKEGGDLAVDWTDVETFARPGSAGRASVDPDTSFGHRKGDAPGQEHEMFLGYYLQLATMVAEVGAPRIPELIRRMLLTSCRLDPPPAFVPVLARLFASGVAQVMCWRTVATPIASQVTGPFRCGRPAPGSCRISIHTTAGRRAPSAGRPSGTGSCTAQPHRGRYSSSARSPAAPPARSVTSTSAPFASCRPTGSRDLAPMTAMATTG